MNPEVVSSPRSTTILSVADARRVFKEDVTPAMWLSPVIVPGSSSIILQDGDDGMPSATGQPWGDATPTRQTQPTVWSPAHSHVWTVSVGLGAAAAADGSSVVVMFVQPKGRALVSC